MRGKIFGWRARPGKGRDGQVNAGFAAAEAKVVAFGEALRTHGFTPAGTDADKLPLRELGRALDAYEQATKALDGEPDVDAVLHALDEGQRALDRLDARLAGRPLPQPPVQASGTAKNTKSHRVEVPREQPAVVEFRTEQPARIDVRVTDRAGHGSRLYPLGGGVDPVVAHVPVPGKRRALEFTLDFPDGDEVAWTARAASVQDVPDVGDGLRGDGTALVHFEEGRTGRGALRNRGRGQVALEALDDGLAFWVNVASGTGDVDLEFRWPGPGYYQVRTSGTWALEVPDAS